MPVRPLVKREFHLQKDVCQPSLVKTKHVRLHDRRHLYIMELMKIANLYDNPTTALTVLWEASRKKHRFLRSESSFENFLKKELAAKRLRTENGAKSPLSILKNTLDTSAPKIDGIPGFHNGFDRILWQENDGQR